MTKHEKEVLALLKRGRARIEKGWCQEALARDEAGGLVATGYNPGATQWCAMGALQEPGNSGAWVAAIEALEAEIPKSRRTPGGLPVYNDNYVSTPKPILRLYDRAIAKLEGK